jgi:hypothetical protein
VAVPAAVVARGRGIAARVVNVDGGEHEVGPERSS